MEGKTYGLKQAAKKLGRHYLTLYRWEKAGKIRPARRLVLTRARVYTDADLQEIRDWMSRVEPQAPTSTPVVSNPDSYKVAELAALLRVSSQEVRRLCGQGSVVGAYRVGYGRRATWCIPRKSLKLRVPAKGRKPRWSNFMQDIVYID